MRWITGILAAIVLGTSARAAPYIWDISGHVTSVTGDPAALAGVGGSAAVGDAFSVRFTIDQALAVAEPLSPTHVVWFDAITNTQIQVGSWNRSFPAQTASGVSNSQIIAADNDPGLGSLYNLTSQDWLFGSVGLPMIQVGFNVGSVWNPGGTSFLSSTDILTTPVDLSFPFDYGPDLQIELTDIGFNPSSNAFIDARPESITLLSVRPHPPGVPEPGIWALMFVGFAALGAAVRRQGSQRKTRGRARATAAA
jgi:hypothetical protein